MSARKIIYTRPDGGLSIVSVPADTDEAITKAMAVLPSDALNAAVVDESVIPTDRTFRNAFKQNGSMVEHDMQKCREIHRDKLRQFRAPKLAALDTAYLLADERGDTVEKQRVAQQKQALRDVTADTAIDSARTPEELKAVMPEPLR